MQSYEYKVVPAPVKGEKERGLKTGAERFAHALESAMNEMAAGGWEYCRAETLPAEERSGLTSKTTVYHNLLVFRRPVGGRAAPLTLGNGTGSAQAVPAGDTPAERRERILSAFAPEGRAPRLGPAEEDEA